MLFNVSHSFIVLEMKMNVLIRTAALTASVVSSSSVYENVTIAPVDAVGELVYETTVIVSEEPQMALIIMTSSPLPDTVVVDDISRVEARCDAEERAVWINNQNFTRAYQQAAAAAWGESQGTIDRLSERYPELSRDCLGCLGEATACSRTHCWIPCISDQSGEACRTCINTNCIPAMLVCTGAENPSQLPQPPESSVRPSSPGLRTRPSTLPRLLVPNHNETSHSEHSPALSGPGRLRDAMDATGWDLAGMMRGVLGTDAMTLSFVIALVAALIAVIAKWF